MDSTSTSPAEPSPRGGAWRVPAFLRDPVDHLGGLGLMLGRTAREALKPRRHLGETLRQMDALGVQSLAITSLTALFTGMVLALQTSYALQELGGKFFMSRVVALSLTRELGPTLTALMIAARVGAGITAELGTMAVTEQVDALRALGASPLGKLVLPRVVAVVLMLPVLTVIADFLGILGGLFIAVVDSKVGAGFYLTSTVQALHLRDVMHGLCKTPFFGLEIAAIGCYCGLTATGGADGVGRATTRSVVFASITILISDFFLSKLFLALPFGGGG